MAMIADDTAAGELTRLADTALEAVLQSHARFLERRPGGQRALLGFHDLEECNFHRRNLSDADFSGAKLLRAVLTGAKLRNSVLFAADLRVANLDDADLGRADLRGACFRGAHLNRALMNNADLREATIARYDARHRLLAGSFGDPRTDFSCIEARGADLSNAKLGAAIV